MADVEMSTHDDGIQDVVKSEGIHEEINLPTELPQSSYDDDDEDVDEPSDLSVKPESPRKETNLKSESLITTEENDLQCQEILRDEVEMGAEVEVGAEPPRKRGRGRPRGSTAQPRTHHIKSSAPLRSSPRGESHDDHSSPPPRPSCPDIIAHTVASGHISTSSSSGVKRGRGRPPKVKLPTQTFPDDPVSQINHHINNLNEVMNNPLLSQGPPNLMMSPHQILLQQHQLYEQTRRLIQQQQMLLAQHQQAALAVTNQGALSPPLVSGGNPVASVTGSAGATKRGRGRPRGSTTPKPPKSPKMKSLNADGTPKQRGPYKKRQPKSDGEGAPKAKRKYTKKLKSGENTDDVSTDPGSIPVVKEKGKRGRKPKNQTAGGPLSDEKTARKERKQKEKKPREKKPKKGKNASHLPTAISLDDRDSDGGSSTDSVVFFSEEPPPPIMSSPNYNSSNSGSRHSSANNNNHKDRQHNSAVEGTKDTRLPAEDNSKRKKIPSSPVIRRLEDSSSDSSSGSSSSDDSESSSSSDGDSSSSSSDEGENNSSSSRSHSPSSPRRSNNQGHPDSVVNAGDDYTAGTGDGQAANGAYNHQGGESPRWWYNSHKNEVGGSESSDEDGEGGNHRSYNSNSPPPRSPSSASSESPDKSYQCHVCRKWFSSPVTLRIHKRSHQTKPNSGGGSGSGGRAPRRYECDCCDATFTRRERLEQHRSEKHRGTLTERCEVCGRGFEDEEQQKKHLATHTADERAGRCGECGATYNSWDQLRRHRATHTPPASYVCNLCRKSFTYSHSLSRHLSNHSKAVYRCVVCKMSFNDYDSLAQHLNSHLDRYKQLKTS